MRKLLTLAALFLLAASRAFAQGDGAPLDGVAKDQLPSFVRLGDVRAEAARLLHAQTNRERAWGAYLAGRNDLKDLAPALAELLADPNLAAGGWQESAVRQSALDALIRLDAERDADTLLPLYPTSPDEVLILLARSPQKNREALLSLFNDDMTTARWLAAGNLLAATRAPGFAARLLKGLKIEASVLVSDREIGGGYGGGCGGGCGCGVDGSVPQGFPPVSHYTLVARAERDAVVVAPGRHNVYYVRGPWPRGCDGMLACEVSRDTWRVEYLADLLDTTVENLKLNAFQRREIVCKDEEQCRLALAGLRDEIVGSYSTLLARLAKENLLDPADASELKPDITLDITDWRGKKTFPLPDRLDGVKISVNGVEAPPSAAPDESSDSSLNPPD
jgi:hypothetical protein